MSAFEESGLDVAECPLLTPSGHRASYAAEGLRIPNALIARSFMSTGSRTPVAVTLTTDLTINSVIGSSRLVTQRSINAPSYAAVATLAPVHNEIFGVSNTGINTRR
jgi:hypothetical protein